MASKQGNLKKHNVSGDTVAMVSYRCGTKMTHRFHSITCEVEVTLPVLLTKPAGHTSFDQSEVEDGLNEAVAIAERVYTREAKSLRKTLLAMSKE